MLYPVTNVMLGVNCPQKDLKQSSSSNFYLVDLVVFDELMILALILG